jgi:hypothetical protein
MFAKTSTPANPWIIVKGNDKIKTRMEAMCYILDLSDYEKKGETGERLKPDTNIVDIIRCPISTVYQEKLVIA